jgi:hypothetical protein
LTFKYIIADADFSFQIESHSNMEWLCSGEIYGIGMATFRRPKDMGGFRFSSCPARRLALLCEITFSLEVQALQRSKNISLRGSQDGDISPLPTGRGRPLGEIGPPPLFFIMVFSYMSSGDYDSMFPGTYLLLLVLFFLDF